MKIAILLVSFITASSNGSWITPVSCDQMTSQNTEEKQRFRGGFDIRVADITYDEYSEQHVLFRSTEKVTSAQYQPERYELLDMNTGLYRKRYPTSNRPGEVPNVIINEEIIQPHILYKHSEFTLIGSDSGEWGGELMALTKSGQFKRLGLMNVKDIYRMPFGFVVISGLAHMHENKGTVHVVNENLDLDLMFGLVANPNKIHQLNSGEILISSDKIGSQLLSLDGHLKRVDCELGE